MITDHTWRCFSWCLDIHLDCYEFQKSVVYFFFFFDLALPFLKVNSRIFHLIPDKLCWNLDLADILGKGNICIFGSIVIPELRVAAFISPGVIAHYGYKLTSFLPDPFLSEADSPACFTKADETFK